MKDITNISNLQSVLTPNLNPAKKTEHEAGESSFSDVLKESISKVNNLQNEAEAAIKDLAVGDAKDVHNTMIAIEKADVSFQVMMQVRNKIVEAYQEVIKMPV